VTKLKALKTLETHPYRYHPRYGEVVECKSLNDARSKIKKTLDAQQAWSKRFASDALEGLLDFEAEVNRLTDDDLPVDMETVVDPYSGTRFGFRLWKERV
jgi:hypothetical protein